MTAPGLSLAKTRFVWRSLIFPYLRAIVRPHASDPLDGLHGPGRGPSFPPRLVSKVIVIVGRQFKADGPNKLWVADITYVPTWAGFLFLAVVIDVWSRKVVGWSMATHLRTELVLAALEMAVAQRQPTNVVHHSDHGTQYTSVAFGQRCRQAGVQPSMGTVGDAYDNALCESFFASLECELLDRTVFTTQAEGRMAVFQYIEGWYNPHRRHSAIDYQSPVNYERKYVAAA